MSIAYKWGIAFLIGIVTSIIVDAPWPDEAPWYIGYPAVFAVMFLWFRHCAQRETA